MKEKEMIGHGKLFEAIQDIKYQVVEPESTHPDETEIAGFQKLLYQNYLRGEYAPGQEQSEALPVLLAPFLREQDSSLGYPVVYDREKNSVEELLDVLNSTFESTFKENEAEELRDRLSQVATYIGDNEGFDFSKLLKDALVRLVNLFPFQDENKVFEESCAQFHLAISKRNLEIVRATNHTVFILLNLQLAVGNKRNGKFLELLKNRISGLQDLLLLQVRLEEKTGKDAHYTFAEDLLSIGKIEEVAASSTGSRMPKARLDRIQQCVNTLAKALASYEEYSSTVLVPEELKNEFALEKHLFTSRVKVCTVDTLSTARKFSEDALDAFVQVSAALKLAALELDHKYDEDLHAPYFERFDLTYLSDQDLEFFRPIVVIEESNVIARDQGNFIAMISGNVPVKILALNRFDDLGNGAGLEESGHELAALAIFRRNAYVFQGASDTPAFLHQALGKGLSTPFPAFWHILAGNQDAFDDRKHPTLFRAAIASRHFPRVEFDVSTGKGFGSHFHVDINPFKEQDFPKYPLELEVNGSIQERQYILTPADFLAAIPKNRGQLEMVPGGFNSEDLIPISEYLVKEPGLLTGKIPYIWLVDEANILVKGVVPLAWLKLCRTRLEFWQFLQELGGTNSYHTQRALEVLRADLEERKTAEIDQLESRLITEFETTREQQLGHAITRMLYGLLDPEQMQKAPAELVEVATAISGEVAQVAQETRPEPTPEEKEIEEKPPAPVSSEVWVESDLCTSCSDCIDALPSVFKYNNDKQAYVHNPAGGTYAKIVAIAEKCPARCIHPGLPHNPDEPNLEKFIKRAEKFN